MAKYILKRLLMALITLWIIVTLTFVLMNVVPGGPFLAEKSPSAATLAALKEKYGLDQPLTTQYFNYVSKLLQGDMGPSIKQRGRTVVQIITSRFPISATIGSISIVVALLLGVPLGSIAALNRGKWVDNTIIVISTVGIAVPSFVVSIGLMMFFSLKLGWFPVIFKLNSAASLVMPVIALSFYPMAYMTRLMRSSMLEVLGQDYMRTAKSKGLSQFVSLFKHALRNAILPIITYMGPLLAYTLTGSFVVEKIFTIPGLGNEFISCIVNRDYTMIMGTTIFLATLIIFMNVVVDIVYKFVDPRIKFR